MRFFNRLTWFQWLLMGFFVLTFTGTIGLAFGYITGSRDREDNLARAIATDIQTQYDLGLQDFEDGNYALARQRFDYVVQNQPNFPGAVDKLAETIILLSEPAVQITDIPRLTSTPSSTPDTRQVDELFLQAEEQFRNQAWKALVQTIVALRDIDPLYRTSNVDRMLFLGLRFSGIAKIMEDGNLEGGLYDLALVERFAPLDSQARIHQEWARLYQIGVSFWGVFPDKSAYYFNQLASAAPYLRDFSGIYAKDRYLMALLQYGDMLSKSGEWCLALEQFKMAQTLLDDQGLQPTLTFSENQCLAADEPSTPTPGIEIIWTPTMTLTPSLVVTLEMSPTPTSDLILTPTPEATSEIFPTATLPAETPTPTLIVIEPTETPMPTSTTEAVP